MTGGFGTDPEVSRVSARTLAAVAETMDDAAVALRSALSALGDVCGADEQGRAFAAAYRPRSAEGLAAVDALALAVRSLAPALDGDAASFAEGDAAGARALDPP